MLNKIYSFYFNKYKIMEFVLAGSKKEAKYFYLEYSQCENLDGCQVSRVLKKDWIKNIIVDEDTGDKITFLEKVNQINPLDKPQLIATDVFLGLYEDY